MSNWKSVYEKWAAWDTLDSSLKQELEKMKDNEIQLEDAFYTELTFGTGGMRGILGPGINRMNVYTVRKAVSGLANNLLKRHEDAKERGVVIAYDSRYMSKEFAEEAAKVLGYFGIKSYVFESLRPTPLLSYTVRHLKTAAGIMITASHNPPEYNGFKVYNEQGAQITPQEAEVIISEIGKVGNELNVPYLEKEDAEQRGLLNRIGEEVDEAYLAELLNISKLDEEDQDRGPFEIVFTPLHGTAFHLVTEGLRQLGFTNVSVVPEQAVPDPEFSTVTSPNPEEHQAFEMAIELGEKQGADLLLGTDPDADRLGVAVKNQQGVYQVLTGNQLGVLLLDYILSHTDKALLATARMIKTIVTTELGRAVADYYSVPTLETLTGFKFIAEKIGEFEQTGETFIFGFEESYGYLIDSFARDKDAVQAAVMASEMAYYWKKQGKTLLDALDVLFERHGYYIEDMTSLTLKGKKGSEQIQSLMKQMRENTLKEVAGLSVEVQEDYLTSERVHLKENRTETIDLPQENVLKFILEDEVWICLRPSGTEPKIKCYYGVCESTRDQSEKQLTRLKEEMEAKLDQMIARS